MKAALALGLALAVVSSLPSHARGGIGVWGQQTEERVQHAEVACLRALQGAEQKSEIPRNYLTALGFTEAGKRLDNGGLTVWPWTVNVEGKGFWFATRNKAIAFVKAQQDQGVRSIDVGCMQINLRWHPDAFRTLEDAFNPASNVAYAVDFLTRLRSESNSWSGAIGKYHSRDAKLARAYTERVMANRRFSSALRELARSAIGLSGSGPAHSGGGGISWVSDGRMANMYGSLPVQPVLPELVGGEG